MRIILRINGVEPKSCREGAVGQRKTEKIERVCEGARDTEKEQQNKLREQESQTSRKWV